MAAFMHKAEADGTACPTRTMDVLRRDVNIEIFFPGPTQSVSLVELFNVFLEGQTCVARVSAGG